MLHQGKPSQLRPSNVVRREVMFSICSSGDGGYSWSVVTGPFPGGTEVRSQARTRAGSIPDSTRHRQDMTLTVYSHWLTPGPEQGTGTGTGKMGCMRLYRTFHTTQEPGPESGPEK